MQLLECNLQRRLRPDSNARLEADLSSLSNSSSCLNKRRHRGWPPSHSNKNEFIRSFFGRIHGLTICFRNYVTFMIYKVFRYLGQLSETTEAARFWLSIRGCHGLSWRGWGSPAVDSVVINKAAGKNVLEKKLLSLVDPTGYESVMGWTVFWISVCFFMIFFQFSISIFKLFVKSKVIHEGVLTKELLQEREFQFENTCFFLSNTQFFKKVVWNCNKSWSNFFYQRT